MRSERLKSPKKHPNGGELTGEDAAGHLRSRGGGGRSARRLAFRREREVEKRDGEVRFYVRPSLPELEVTLPSFISRPSSFPVEY